VEFHAVALGLASMSGAPRSGSGAPSHPEPHGPRLQQIEDSTKILTEGLASIHLAMSDMADGHIDNEELVRAMFSRIQVDPHGGRGDGK
jgi:hypothetical protein